MNNYYHSVRSLCIEQSFLYLGNDLVVEVILELTDHKLTPLGLIDHKTSTIWWSMSPRDVSLWSAMSRKVRAELDNEIMDKMVKALIDAK